MSRPFLAGVLAPLAIGFVAFLSAIGAEPRAESAEGTAPAADSAGLPPMADDIAKPSAPQDTSASSPQAEGADTSIPESPGLEAPAAGDAALDPAAEPAEPTVTVMKPTKWSVAANNGAAATIIHIDEGAVVTVTEPGRAVFDIQLMCSEFAIVQDRWYTLTFEARAKRPRRIGYHISMVHPPWNGMGFGGTVDVGTEWKEYEAEFQARTGDEKTGVFFPIGGSLTGLEVRNVQLAERLEADPRAKIWQLSAGRHSRARMEFPKDDPQAMRIEIERKGRSQWNIIAAINGGPVKIYKKYALRFRAKADEDGRPIGFLVTQSYDPFNNLGLYEDIELTSEWEEQRFEFSSTGNDENVRIAFLAGDSTVPVELADVRIEPLDVRAAEGPLPPPSRAHAWMLIAAFWAVVGLILLIKRRRVREWFEDIQQGQAEAARRREASQESRSRRRSLSRRT